MPTQDKFVQIANELPMIIGFPGCEVRAKGLSYGVQRPKGGIDEPTVGDRFVSMGKALACLPLIERCFRGQVWHKARCTHVVRGKKREGGLY